MRRQCEKYNPKDIFQREYYESLYKRYPKLNVYMSHETLNPPIEEQPKIITVELRKFPEDRNHKRDNLISERIKRVIELKNITMTTQNTR